MDIEGIELLDVSKKYKNARAANAALSNVNLTILPGQYVGITGVNGSGKSTLVRLLNGLIQPGRGKVYVDGLDTSNPGHLPLIRRLVGVVFQNPDNQLLSPLVEEEIAFGLENLDLPLQEISRRIEWALQLVGLEAMKHHSPNLLSGGQKQKVALAAVLAMKPKYLVLDEPTSMLDTISRKELLDQLKTLHGEGMTIILSSHNPEDLVQADRIIVIDQGSIHLQGAPWEVYRQEAELAAIGLEPPGLYMLLSHLTRNEYSIDGGIKTTAELVQYICSRL
ncbi:MAG TPA: energy-coupling factor transporter ATPase [Syntrophomonas sp.]|jgi:energy-coupling factor transport system ATP-binding protein|nr:energy-coupling factor transporter ATPase [Syntrophomonas sp.]